MAIILATTAVTLSKLGNSTIAQGQGNLTIGNQTITPKQRAAICNPNNPKLNFVNTTESRICGIPKTVISNMSNTTTSPEAPSVSPPLPALGS